MMFSGELISCDRGRRQVGQRMPHELRFDAALAVELFLEREDDQHLADILPHPFDASPLPRPQLRAHVINDRHAALVHFAGEPQIEVGEVDEDGSIGTTLFGLAHYLAKTAIDGRNVLHDLDDADFGDLAGVHQQLAAGSTHLLSADAEEFDLSIRLSLRKPLAQGFDQLCAIEFAGRFSCGDEDSHSGIMTGARPLSAIAGVASISAEGPLT